MNNNIKIFIAVVVVLVLGVLGTVLMRAGNIAVVQGPGEYDEFAQCLSDKGAKFYGAFWCPHCANQKKMFGSSQKFLPYIECSNPAGSAQLPICTEKGINTYPTWEFADGSRLSGEIPMAQLAEKTGCVLPPEKSL